MPNEASKENGMLSSKPLEPAHTALVLGAGAIGALYGHVLSRAGLQVSVIARSEADLIRRAGYQIKSISLGLDYFKPHCVLGHTSDWSDAAPDILLVCMKVLPSANQIELMRPVVGNNTRIVLIQNGIEIEAPVQAAFPDNEIVSALAFVQVSRIGPAVVEHFSYGELTIGTYPSGVGSGCAQLGELLARGGIPGKLTEDVVAARWAKCLWNAPFNPASAITGSSRTHTILNTMGGESLIRAMMLEVFNIAQAAGHLLPTGIIDEYIAATKAAQSYQTSTALDALHHREMETEAILGNTVRAAERLGVEAPKLSMLYTLMKVFEASTV